MTIEKILSLPEMVRNEDDTAYVYPEDYQDKLYAFDGKYVILRGNTNESIPKEILDRVIETKLENLDIEQIPFDLSNDETALKIIDNRITEALADSFNNINRVIDNVNDKLGSTLELKHLQEFRQQIEATINNMFEDRGKMIEGFDVNEFMKDFNLITVKLNELEETVNSFGENKESVNINEETIKQIISQELNSSVKKIVLQELTVVHENLPNIVKDIIDQTDLPKATVKSVSSENTKLTLGQLVALKESGYSVQEIKDLKEEGLI